MAALLVFDTAGERLVVAAGRDGALLASCDEAGGAKASQRLLPAITAVLADAGLALRDLAAIGVGRGPGAFTGVRTACAVAQGLAWGASLPVLLVDDLMAVAEDARLGGRLGESALGAAVWTVADARMDEVYAACWQLDGGGRWQTRVAPFVASPEAVNARWRADAPGAVAGDGLRVHAGRLQTGAARVDAEARPGAAALLSLAFAAWAAGEAVDAAQAVPLYVRDKVAQTTAEREAARSAKGASTASTTRTTRTAIGAITTSGADAAPADVAGGST